MWYVFLSLFIAFIWFTLMIVNVTIKFSKHWTIALLSNMWYDDEEVLGTVVSAFLSVLMGFGWPLALWFWGVTQIVKSVRDNFEIKKK